MRRAGPAPDVLKGAPIDIDPVFSCWRWMGGVDSDGYGRQRGRRVHILVWEALIGAIPEGMEIEHECRDRSCCNPAHLELVTRSENERRKAWRHRVRRKVCKNGHDLKVHAMITPNGGRICRLCSRGAISPPVIHE